MVEKGLENRKQEKREHMNIIEQFSMSKTGIEIENEDSIVITDSFVSIIDGMTSKDNSLYQNETSARIATELLKKEIHSFPRDLTYQEAVYRLTKCICSYYKENNIFNVVLKEPHKRMAASIIILNKEREEIWIVGDCHCLIDELHITNEKLVDYIISEIRSVIIEKYLLEYSTDELLEKDLSREDIRPFLISQYLYQNNRAYSPLSYAVIDGFPIENRMVRVVSCKDANCIVLGSDGYPQLKRNLRETELELQKLLQKDPLMIKGYKSTKGLVNGNKSFDDRTYIKIKL
ncbi:hypothetical protein [Bacillus thuringiensis]|uniref:hypothetical protein n=2 Tax=Bacillus TaxID=1386 RepID=UPI002A6B5878|nr:hypothetical protein [Bacillus thuringiensis]